MEINPLQTIKNVLLILSRKQPFAVTATADSREKAFFEALEKMQRVLDTTLEKIKEH